MKHFGRVVVGSSMGLVFTGLASAGWPLDPATNVAVVSRTAEQTLPKIAATPDGGCYVGFHDLTSGSYDLFLQRYDRDGNAQWAAGGIAVSVQPQPSSLVDWALASASNGDCVLVFTDSRAGSDRDVYAYRVSPSGAQLWGANGITLSVNDDSEAAPRLAELDDDSFVFVWPILPTGGSGRIVAQRITPSGSVLFPSPLTIVSAPPESPAFCDVVSGGGTDFIVSWVRDTRAFASPRHLRAQKFDGSGAPLWGAAPLEIYNLLSLPIAYNPQLRSDGAGGAVIAWHRSSGSRFDSFVQHVFFNGALGMPANGALVTTDLTRQHFDPTIAVDESTGDINVFWDARDATQGQRGIRAQRMSSVGALLFGANGVEIEPVDTTVEGLPRAAIMPDGGAAVVYLQATGSVTDVIRAVRLRPDGSRVWGPGSTLISSVTSDKSRLPITVNGFGSIIATWEDDRALNRDIYAQALHAGGALGVLGDLNCDGIVSVGDIAAFVLALTDAPNYPASYPACDIRLADVNGDGSVSVGDIAGFVGLLVG
ncbi:MAG: hypothetical protein SF069_11270 [Phycisphaerae bacterium]|nr:hypothetical protein [Phycisphaerae bacterium]